MIALDWWINPPRWLLGLLFVPLAACATTQPQIVKVPVPVPCLSEKPELIPYPPSGTPDEGLFVRVQRLLAEREIRIANEARMEAALTACIDH